MNGIFNSIICPLEVCKHDYFCILDHIILGKGSKNWVSLVKKKKDYCCGQFFYIKICGQSIYVVNINMCNINICGQYFLYLSKCRS